MNVSLPAASGVPRMVFRSLCLTAAILACGEWGGRPACGRDVFPPPRVAPAAWVEQAFFEQPAAAPVMLAQAFGPVPQGFGPPNYQPIHDQQGQQWSINSNGYIQGGTNGSLSNASVLQVQGSGIQVTNVAMSPDGDEYVFSGQRGHMLITRRMRIDREAGVVRHVDTFRNNSPNAVNVPVVVSTQFGRAQAGSTVTERGRDNPQAFEAGEEAILAWADPNTGQSSVMFHVGEGKDTPRPTLHNDSNASFRFEWNLNLKPGESASIVHAIAQRHLAAQPSKAELAKLVRPLRSGTWIRSLPRDVTKTIINRRHSGYWAATPQAALDWEALGVQPQELDMLAIGESTRLTGAVLLDKVSVVTRFGELPVPIAEIAAIAGPGFSGGRTGILMRNQECYTGDLRLEGLAFTLASGLKIDVDPDRLDRLVFRKPAKETAPATVFLETVDGDRVAFDPAGAESVRLQAVTPWGTRSASLEQVAMMQAGSEGGYQLALADGSRFFAFLESGPIPVQTGSFGPREFQPEELRYVQTGQPPQDEDDLPSPTEPYFDLAGDNRLIGRLELSRIRLSMQGQELPLDPREIRDLTPIDDSTEAGDDRTWQVMLWDGSSLQGRLIETMFPIVAGEEKFQLPLADLREMHVRAYPEKVRARVAGLIVKLGDRDFETRESATRELRQLGEVAEPLLRTTLEDGPDAEIRQRIRALLAED